jgi:hypothetical protein
MKNVASLRRVDFVLQPVAGEIFPASHPNLATTETRDTQGRLKGITKPPSRIRFLLSIEPRNFFLH